MHMRVLPAFGLSERYEMNATSILVWTCNEVLCRVLSEWSREVSAA